MRTMTAPEATSRKAVRISSVVARRSSNPLISPANRRLTCHSATSRAPCTSATTGKSGRWACSASQKRMAPVSSAAGAISTTATPASVGRLCCCSFKGADGDRHDVHHKSIDLIPGERSKEGLNNGAARCEQNTYFGPIHTASLVAYLARGFVCRPPGLLPLPKLLTHERPLSVKLDSQLLSMAIVVVAPLVAVPVSADGPSKSTPGLSCELIRRHLEQLRRLQSG